MWEILLESVIRRFRERCLQKPDVRLRRPDAAHNAIQAASRLLRVGQARVTKNGASYLAMTKIDMTKGRVLR